MPPPSPQVWTLDNKQPDKPKKARGSGLKLINAELLQKCNIYSLLLAENVKVETIKASFCGL